MLGQRVPGASRPGAPAAGDGLAMRPPDILRRREPRGRPPGATRVPGRPAGRQVPADAARQVREARQRSCRDQVRGCRRSMLQYLTRGSIVPFPSRPTFVPSFVPRCPGCWVFGFGGLGVVADGWVSWLLKTF